MEKLKAQDQEKGKAPPRRLTVEEKAKIAEVRSFYESKLAEREILYQDELKKAGPDPERRTEVENCYREDRQKLEREREGKLEKLRT